MALKLAVIVVVAIALLLVNASAAWAASTSQPTSAPAAGTLPRPARPGRQPDADWEKSHAEFTAQAKAGGIDLLFVGDSITRGWRGAKDLWEKDFAEFKPANFGIGGDRIEHILYRLGNGELDGRPPRRSCC